MKPAYLLKTVLPAAEHKELQNLAMNLWSTDKSTFDKDFGELAFRSKLPAGTGIILFRLKASSSKVIAEKVTTAISLRDDWVGHFSVIEEDKIRMRLLSNTRL